MSAATAQATDTSSPKKGIGKKRLLIIGGIVLLVMVLSAVAVVVVLKMQAAAHAADEEDADEEVVAVEEEKHAPKRNKDTPPVFLPLDTFTVNLADKNVERYAQVGITLEVDTPDMAEKLKIYMPAIRNNVLMVLSHKTSSELLERAGKEKLAEEIMREAVRPLGIDIPAPEDEAARSAQEGDEAKPKSKKKKSRKPVYNPVLHVHFSNFIIQ